MTEKLQWNSATVGMLTELHYEGYSCALIARKIYVAFDVYITRSAVISKKSRLGLVSLDRPIHELTPVRTLPKNKPKPEKRIMIKKPQYKPPKLPITPLVENVAKFPTPLRDIDHEQCHWIIQDPDIMCGDPVAARRPYCLYHCNLARRPMRENA